MVNFVHLSLLLQYIFLLTYSSVAVFSQWRPPLPQSPTVNQPNHTRTHGAVQCCILHSATSTNTISTTERTYELYYYTGDYRLLLLTAAFATIRFTLSLCIYVYTDACMYTNFGFQPWRLSHFYIHIYFASFAHTISLFSCRALPPHSISFYFVAVRYIFIYLFFFFRTGGTDIKLATASGTTEFQVAAHTNIFVYTHYYPHIYIYNHRVMLI